MIEVTLIAVLTLTDGRIVNAALIGIPPIVMDDYSSCIHKLKTVPDIVLPKGIKAINFSCVSTFKESLET